MKRVILGTLVGVGIVMTAVAVAEQRGDVVAHASERRLLPAAGSELIVVPTPVGDKARY